MGAYQRVEPATAEQTSRQQITSSPSAPSIVQQVVFMAWLMLMQMQQLVSGFSTSSQRSNYFFCFVLVFFLCLFFGFTHKKKKKKQKRRLLREWFRLWPWWLQLQISVSTAAIGPAIPPIMDTCHSYASLAYGMYYRQTWWWLLSAVMNDWSAHMSTSHNDAWIPHRLTPRRSFHPFQGSLCILLSLKRLKWYGWRTRWNSDNWNFFGKIFNFGSCFAEKRLF